jgi:type IV pilus assembly protein PilN
MIRVNLLPDAQKKTRGSKKKKGPRVKVEIPLTWIILGLVVVLITCVGLGIHHLSMQRKAESIQTEIQRYQDDIKQLKLDVQKVERVRSQRSELNNKLAVIDRLKNAQKGPVHLLDQLASCIPQRVWLTKMTENGKQMRIEGLALEHAQVSRFMQNLDRSPLFDRIELSGTQTAAVRGKGEGESSHSFTLACEVSMPKEFM